MTTLLTGATGFVGSHILSLLLSRGHTVHALARDPSKLPPHPKLRPFPGDISNPASLATAATNCSATIHLVGIIAETKTQSFHAIHVTGTQNVITASQNAGVTRFIHMSALGTRPNAPSQYHQTKWAAEELLRASPLAHTIFRPSLIYGPGGEFTAMLRDWSLGKIPPFFFMPFFGQGLLGQSNPFQIQPIHIDNVASLFADAVHTPASINKTYNVAGPDRFTWPQFLAIASAAHRQGRPKLSLGIPAWLGFCLAKTLTILHLPAPFNRDQILMSLEPNTADLTPLLTDFPTLPLKKFPSSDSRSESSL